MDDSLLVAYLEEFGGDVYLYRKFLKHHQRHGQAFFNALSDIDKCRLRFSIHDTFYMDEIANIEETIMHLIPSKGKTHA